MSRNFNNTYRFNNNCQGNRNNNGTNLSCNNYMYNNNNCTSLPDTYDEFPVGMAYVPSQKFQNLYEPCECLKAGTIFKELYKPFLG